MTGAPYGNVYGLGVELARPIQKGWLPRAVAEAILLLTAERTTPQQYSVEKVADCARWFMRQECHRLAWQRDLAVYRIERSTWRLIERREPPNVVLRDAFDLNAAAGTPLDEPQVRSIVGAVVRAAIAAEGRKKHG